MADRHSPCSITKDAPSDLIRTSSWQGYAEASLVLYNHYVSILRSTLESNRHEWCEAIRYWGR